LAVTHRESFVRFRSFHVLGMAITDVHHPERSHRIMVEILNESEVESIDRRWDKALSQNDVDVLTALYAPDATIESPLIPHVMGIQGKIMVSCETPHRIVAFIRRALASCQEPPVSLRRHVCQQ